MKVFILMDMLKQLVKASWRYAPCPGQTPGETEKNWYAVLMPGIVLRSKIMQHQHSIPNFFKISTTKKPPQQCREGLYIIRK